MKRHATVVSLAALVLVAVGPPSLAEASRYGRGRRVVPVVPGLFGFGPSHWVKQSVRQARGIPLVVRDPISIFWATVVFGPPVVHSSGTVPAALAGVRPAVEVAPVYRFGAGTTVVGTRDPFSGPRPGDQVARGHGHLSVCTSDEAIRAIMRAYGLW
jgi:hypothetical protein